MTSLDIVGLCGSLRQESFNRMALNLAASAMPATLRMDILEWRELPPFDANVLKAGVPLVVHNLAERIRRCDGIVIATPEYNFSIPGMFKNTLDWLSRGERQPFARKPVAILSAATGPLGGARVQYELRRVLQFLDCAVLGKPEIFIGAASTKFDASGRCVDDTTRAFVTAQMAAFETWVALVQRMQP